MSDQEKISVEDSSNFIMKNLDTMIQECSREELEYLAKTLIIAKSLCKAETSIDWEATVTTKCRICGHTATREAKSTAFFGFEQLFKIFGITITPTETCPDACVAHGLIGIPNCPNGCNN